MRQAHIRVRREERESRLTQVCPVFQNSWPVSSCNCVRIFASDAHLVCGPLCASVAARRYEPAGTGRLRFCYQRDTGYSNTCTPCLHQDKGDFHRTPKDPEMILSCAIWNPFAFIDRAFTSPSAKRSHIDHSERSNHGGWGGGGGSPNKPLLSP